MAKDHKNGIKKIFFWNGQKLTKKTSFIRKLYLYKNIINNVYYVIV